MTINEAVGAIEKLLAGKPGVAALQVRPSGDDLDVIKVWVDLDEPVDAGAWAQAFEDEVRSEVPGAAPYRLEVRAEAGASGDRR